MKIATFNVRSCYDGIDEKQSFIFRAGLIRDVVAREKPDVIAFQEVTFDILSMLKSIMPGYTFYGHGRMDDFTGEGVYTAISNETAELLGYNVFWLSPTPFVPGSKFEKQSMYPRVCCCTLISDKQSGNKFYVYNIHLDHIKGPAQGQQLEMIVDRMKEREYEFPAVLLGDFNLMDGESSEMEWVRGQDKLPLKQVSGKYETTFHDFGRTTDCTIDYIFATEDMAGKVKEVNLWTDEKHGIYLSDHYPVCAEFEF